MNLPAFCIKRPAFTTVISLVMMIIGLISFISLPVRWIPNINSPQLSITTSYQGANGRLVERDVTKVLEDALSGINGIETINSISRQDGSQINITFKIGQNMDAAVEDVRASIERYRDMLPKEVQSPVVMKSDPDNTPIMFISFFDKHFSARELSDYIDKYIKPTIETIDGVGSVGTFGQRISAMQVRLDPLKMASARITVDEVLQLLQDQNASTPSGQIRGKDRYYSILTDTTLKTPQQFNDLILRDTDNQLLRIKDIGHAELDSENDESFFRVNGKPAVGLAIIPQSTANPLSVEAALQKTIKEMKQTLPENMTMNIVFNQADYIRSSMRSVYEAFLEAVFCVWLVILVFFGSFRATWVPIVTIPVCIISTFSLLYFMNFSINTITLMALVLAIGLVVDDAIVMLENIKRYLEKGLSPFHAALQGSREIIFPVIAMTLTLTAVYAPIAFTSGLLGVLFREFTYTLAGSVIISGVVALTLSPMMCAKILNNNMTSHRYAHWSKEVLIKLQTTYQRFLNLILRKRNWILVFLLLLSGIGILLYYSLSSELSPTENMNEIDVYVSAPRNASYDYTNQYVQKLENLYQKMPEISSYLSMMSDNSSSHSFQILQLKKDKKRQSTQSLLAFLTEETRLLPGVRVNVSTPSPELVTSSGSDEGDKIGLAIMTTGDYRKLQQVSSQLMDAVKALPGITHVSNRLKWNGEQFQINIDRERAADLQVPIASITNAISTLIAGRNVGKTDETNVIVQMNKAALADPNILQQIYVRNVAGNMIPISQLITMTEATIPEVFHHYQRLRSDIIYVSIADDLKLANAIKLLETTAKKIIPDDMKFTFTGEAKSFLESNGKTILTFLLALVFIYLILVAQFESFIDPLIILLTVPFAVIGAMLTLKIFGGSLNIYSNIGLITLVGLIAKHGILITEFANRLRAQGKSIHDAVIAASLLRLRPILMTTAAMVLGAIPLAFATGAGSESRQQIGLVIAGGMLLGTFFSLIVVPVAYTYLAPLHRKHPQEDDAEIVKNEI